ncbi:HTH-type transcriptional regulator ArgP [Usitatibacter rugosus]|uniref:HTH-type transcriptional regulator ArgP n=1 Tax=Usitatibacter rugosus TaxID=2732067 RepID=A0A6M4H0U3_9PROT|nr:LysR substrate-binding domain-containing protein [Usitatibacter rugosus]QJR11427.1 HTH-type transcriptional regulator ArgP [Usitatibacter rugosus]
MDLKQLEYFVRVVDLGGFSRAARVMGVAQPAISRQVRGLEVELRQNLLLRNGRGAVPTEAGKRMLLHARGILQQIERARHDIDESRGAHVGKVVVGLPPTLARHLTLPIVREFRHSHPQATLSIVEGLSSTILDMLGDGRIDIGLVYNPSPTAAFDVRTLYEEALCLVGARRKPAEPRTVRLQDLPGFPLLIPSRPHAIRRLVETRLASLGLQPQIAMEIDAVPAILDLVAEGHGYAVLSPRAVQGASMAARLHARTIVQPHLKSALAVATSAQRPSTPLLQSTVALIDALATRNSSPRRTR